MQQDRSIISIPSGGCIFRNVKRKDPVAIVIRFSRFIFYYYSELRPG